MLIKEVDFKNISQYKNTNVIPVFMQYCEECYEIAINEKQSKNAWSIFQKIFYSKFYEQNKEYLEPLLDVRLFSNEKSRGQYIFSKTDKTFHNELATTKDTATKFAKNAYIGVRPKNYDNLVILKKMVKDTELKNFRLFVSTVDDITNGNFKKEYLLVKKQFTSKKKKNPYKIKKGNLVVGHINGLILNEEEKLIKYIRREFDKKSLLGDITLDESQEIILNNYMRFQLNKFVNSSIKDKRLDFKPDYSRVFAFGLVRYAMKYYNKRHSGDFWPHFKEEFEVEIGVNKQQFLHDEFKRIMNLYNKNYDDTVTNKIDNMTMHSFVADNSAFQLFDCLFDFWRLDLGRSSDYLSTEEGSIAFKTLIDAMEHGTQDIMSHTSLLLNFDKTKMVCKNRVKRILKLIHQAFWNECTINETGNRINHLLNMWIADPKGAFQKEKNYVKKHTLKEKGDVMFHSPIFSMSYDTETLKIILPHQRLIECGEEDNPIWKITCSDSDFNNIELEPEYKHDKIGYYVERKFVEVPLHLMLSEFTFTLVSGDKELKKYKIYKSNIRFFDGKGKYIDYKTANIPVGFVTSYSNNEAYPYVLDEDSNVLYADGLVMKTFELTKGQIIVLDDETGLQAGQKLEEGLNETYPITGAVIENNNIEHQIYAKLPKLVFKSNSDQISGISLIINGAHYKIIDKKIKEFKLADDLKATGYLIDLNDYIHNEGLYSIILSYPKMHVQKSLGSIAYIKDFDYQFKGAPYIFKEFGTIVLKKGLRINKTQSENEGEWKSDFSFNEFTFNFGERKKESDNYCNLVSDRRLKLEYTLNGINYPIYFDIPALYWKFNQSDDWNTKFIANVMLKDLKNKFKKLYISGPFNFIKSVITTTDDVEIAEEESEIKFQSGKNQYFDISKIYDWFKNDRSEVFRKVYISLDEKEYSLFNVVCKSRLVGLSLIGDFDGGVLKGEVNIEGNESYTVTIYHNGKMICEDEQIIDNQFSIETELETGNYEVYVYEISENDDEDGFDVESESILLNNKPIIKRLINLKDLSGQRILLKGYQDINKKYIPRYFNRPYYMVDLEKTTYFDFLAEHEDSEIYGIWDENIDTSDEEMMSKFTYYKAKLSTRRYDGAYQSLMNVLILFKDTMNLDSIIILAKDSDGIDFGSLCIEKDKMWVIPAFQYKKMSKYEKRKCDCFFDDQDFYLIDIEEEK